MKASRGVDLGKPPSLFNCWWHDFRIRRVVPFIWHALAPSGSLWISASPIHLGVPHRGGILHHRGEHPLPHRIGQVPKPIQDEDVDLAILKKI